MAFYPSDAHLKQWYSNTNYNKYKLIPTLTVYKETARQTKAFFWENTVTLKVFGVLFALFSFVLFFSFVSALFKLKRSESSLFRYRILWMIFSILAVIMVLYKLDL